MAALPFSRVRDRYRMAETRGSVSPARASRARPAKRRIRRTILIIIMLCHYALSIPSICRSLVFSITFATLWKDLSGHTRYI
jgi:hypothetical protein